jgi:hypothetical protein
MWPRFLRSLYRKRRTGRFISTGGLIYQIGFGCFLVVYGVVLLDHARHDAVERGLGCVQLVLGVLTIAMGVGGFPYRRRHDDDHDG